MATKTFKIGEYAKNGVITAITSPNKVTIISKEWDFSAGSNKSSDQSKAKEAHRIEVSIDPEDNHGNAERELLDYLCEETTSYYADEILKWVKTKVKFPTNLFW